MKDKHINIRIEQCLLLAEASHCPRRKLAAVLIDPMRDVVLADGYNGGPRGATGHLCAGYFCERDGFKRECVRIEKSNSGVHVHYKDTEQVRTFPAKTFREEQALLLADAWVDEMVEKYPPVKSGTRIEKGCHHAEMNVLMNAAAQGIKTNGAWMIVLAEPCVMCAKLIHHAGIETVVLVDGGYAGGKAGVEYLRNNGVQVQEVEGPKDPRLTK